MVTDQMLRGEVLYALTFEYGTCFCGLAPAVNGHY